MLSADACMLMTINSRLWPSLSHCTLYHFFSGPLHVSQFYRCSNTVFQTNLLSFLQNLFLFLLSLYWLICWLCWLIYYLPSYPHEKPGRHFILVLTPHLIVADSHGRENSASFHPQCWSFIKDHIVSVLTFKNKPQRSAFSLVLLPSIFHFVSKGS